MTAQLCAYCIALFQNAAAVPYYREPNGDCWPLWAGPGGIKEFLRTQAGEVDGRAGGGWLESWDGVRLDSMEPVTMVDGNAACAVHAFDALHQRRYSGAMRR